ncbi:MAG: C25 family cysteine peptidase [Acidobacteriota bacterium]|nr:C25 family cysteine peptidase [Acidobacteriota bacterium]
MSTKTRGVSLLLLLLVLSLPLAAQATFDAQTSVTGSVTPAVTTATFAHTTTTAANRILLVSVHINTNVAPSAAVSSITYGGQALTFLAARNDATNIVRTEVWYLLAPPSGTNNVVVTIGGLTAGQHADYVLGATTFSGVSQIAPTAATNAGVGDPATVTIASTTTDTIVDFITGRENVTLTPDFQTQGYNRSTGSNPSDIHATTSGRTGAAGTTMMSWNVSHSRPWSLIAVRLVTSAVDLAVTKATNDPGTDSAFAEGETLTYTITVKNNGPATATNVVVTDPLPSGFTFVSVSPAANCSQAGGTVTCSYASMANGATNTITITGTISTNTTQLVNTATSTRTQPDTNAANDSATATANVLAPTVVHLLDATAVQDANGRVQISWTTSFEADNLGFNLYRQTPSGRVQINRQLIAGSALFAAKHALTSGRGYRWKDKLRAGEFAQYYLEDIDLHGVRTMHGPITPLLSAEVPEAANTDTLADLGSTGGVFVSSRGIGAPRYPVIAPTRKQREQQWDLASQAAIKLMVTEEGWYRLSKRDLAAAGFIARNRVALFAEGIEQPIVVTNDAIEFYGIGIDTPSSGARAYWLANDKGTGARVRLEKTKAAKSTLTATPFTFERVERTVFFTALTNNGERENFFGAIVTNSGATQEVFVENVDRTAGSATLQLVLQAATGGAHNVALTINGTPLGAIGFNGMSRHVAQVSVPVTVLREGANTLTLMAASEADVTLVESLRLTYPHRLVADNDAFKIALAAGSTATISGFTSPRVRAIDITDAAQPVELAVELSNGNATVAATGEGTRSILVIGESRILAPAQLVPSRASSWNATKNAADLLILTPRAFAPAAEALKARREAQGIATAIVDVQDLYDEFGFGARSPQAIREFLSRTRDWKRAPRYILLLGDASVDPRNYLGLGTFDFVPTKLVPTFYLKAASDDWLVDFDDDAVPQLAIGRLPARTLAEAQTMIRHVLDRNTSGNRRVSFVSDDGFADSAASLGALVPNTLQKTFASDANQAFDSLLLTYIGHGSVAYWNAGGFTGANAAQLHNGTKLPIVAAMTCLNGYFADVYMSSMAETLLANANGGASAVWASSTLTEPVPQLEMARSFFTQLFGGATIGEAAMRAKNATTDMDVRRSWILFGDPSMQLDQ